MIFGDILFDAFFAAIAGVGFGALSDPTVKSLPSIAILAAIGHATRFCLMNYIGMDIASASLIGSFAIGMGSFIAGSIIRSPMTVLAIPALLPMIPGVYAYKTVLALILFMSNTADPVISATHLQMIWTNGLIAFTTTFSLAIGAILPHFVFREKALSLTRNKPVK